MPSFLPCPVINTDNPVIAQDKITQEHRYQAAGTTGGPYWRQRSKSSDPIPSCFLGKSDPISPTFKALILKRGWKGTELEKRAQYYSVILYFEMIKHCFLNMGYRKFNLTIVSLLAGKQKYMHISDSLRENRLTILVCGENFYFCCQEYAMYSTETNLKQVEPCDKI